MPMKGLISILYLLSFTSNDEGDGEGNGDDEGDGSPEPIIQHPGVTVAV